MYNEDLYEYAQKRKIVVEQVKLPKNKSLSVRIHNKDFIAIDNYAVENSAEERTHLAHELGHCVTGSFYEMYSPLQIRGQYENKANKWAIKKLIPLPELKFAIQQGINEVWDLAEYFNVTNDFMIKAIRLYYGINSIY